MRVSETSTRLKRCSSTSRPSAPARRRSVPETPEHLWTRVHGSLSTPPLDEWDTWPFVGRPEPRELAPPADADRPRHGEGGIGCRQCASDLEDALWHDDNWVVKPLQEPSGLPCV